MMSANIRTLNRAQRRKENTRTQLLAATEALLYTEGYAALTVQKITENADLGYGTFYLHFTNLDEAVWEVSKEKLQNFTDGLIEQLATEPPRRRIYLGWIHILQNTRQTGELFVQMYGRRGSTQLTQAYQDWIAHTFETGMQAGHFQPHRMPSIHFQAQYMAGAMMRLLCWWAENNFHHPPEDMARMLYEMTFQEEPGQHIP